MGNWEKAKKLAERLSRALDGEDIENIIPALGILISTALSGFHDSDAREDIANHFCKVLCATVEDMRGGGTGQVLQ